MDPEALDRLLHARRVALIGNGGGGKSTLARALAARTALPLRVVDDVQFLPGWVAAPLDDVARQHAAWLAAEAWIIDGWGSWDLLRERFSRADAVVFVDLALAWHYWGAAKRHAQALLGLHRGWPPPGCRVLPVTGRMARVLWRVHRDMRPRLLAELEPARREGRLLHVRTLRQRRELARALRAHPAG